MTSKNKKSTHQNKLETQLQQQATRISQLEKAQEIEAALERGRAASSICGHLKLQVNRLCSARTTNRINHSPQ